MLRNHLLVMDEYLVGASSAAPAYTSQNLNQALGQFDCMAIHAVVDNATAGAGDFLNVVIEHSGDGRIFTQKNSFKEIGGLNPITTGATTDMWGFDPGTVPSLTDVRLKIWFTNGAATNAHVRIHVTGRSPKPRGF